MGDFRQAYQFERENGGHNVTTWERWVAEYLKTFIEGELDCFEEEDHSFISVLARSGFVVCDIESIAETFLIKIEEGVFD